MKGEERFAWLWATIIVVCLMCTLFSCECIDKNYKTGACAVYQKQDGELIFVSEQWFTRPCGCDDLEETFLRQTPLDTNYCVKCNHPYNNCNSYNTCN